MSKPPLFGLVALSAVLVICGTLVFNRWSFGLRAATGRQPLPAASPSASTAAVLPSVIPIAAPTESDAERRQRERLRAENEKFTQANAPVDETLQKVEADKRRAEASTQAMAMLTGKLLDGSLKVPSTPAEAGSLAGQNLADAAKFRQKWGDSIPAAGTAEADEYDKEKDALVGESAAYLKFMADEKNAALLTQSDGIAKYQEGSLASALALRADQVQGINTALDGYYQQAFVQGLLLAARPPTGTDGWQQQRTALSQQSYAAVSAFLTPEQSTAFQRLFPPAGSWMFIATAPEVLGLDETH